MIGKISDSEAWRPEGAIEISTDLILLICVTGREEMAVRIPPKFGFKFVEEDKPRLSVSDRLKAWSKKLDDDRTQIKPHLGDLFGYYRHTSLIFLPDSELGRFGVWQYCTNENHFDTDLLEKYDKIGQILTQI